MPTLKELKEDRADQHMKAQEYFNQNRNDWTKEHRETFNGMIDKVNTITDQIEALDKIENTKPKADEPLVPAKGGDGAGLMDKKKPNALNIRHGVRGQNRQVPLNAFGKHVSISDKIGEFLASSEYMEFFAETLARGESGTTAVNRLRDVIANHGDLTGTSASDFTEGGWLTTPLQFVQGILECCNDQTMFRQLATIYTVNQACSLGIRKRTSRGRSYARGCVCEAPPLQDNPQGDVKVLEPHYYTASTGLCGDLIRKAAIDVVAYFRDDLVVAVNEGQEQEFWYGDGNKRPLGLLHPDALPETQDYPIILGEEPTAGCDPTDFISMMCTLKLCYLRSGNLAWAMSKSMWCCIMKLTNAYGQFIWDVNGNRGLTEGGPNRLLGYPVMVTEWITGGSTAGEYPIIFGDFSKYGIADAMQMEIEPVRDGLKDTTVWVARGYNDGMPLCEDAFVRGLLTEA